MRDVGKDELRKGLVQSSIPLEFGAGMTLTSAKYLRLRAADDSATSPGGFYEYYTHGGSNRLEKNLTEQTSGPRRDARPRGLWWRRMPPMKR